MKTAPQQKIMSSSQKLLPTSCVRSTLITPWNTKIAKSPDVPPVPANVFLFYALSVKLCDLCVPSYRRPLTKPGRNTTEKPRHSNKFNRHHPKTSANLTVSLCSALFRQKFFFRRVALSVAAALRNPAFRLHCSGRCGLLFAPGTDFIARGASSPYPWRIPGKLGPLSVLELQ
jgi:hypothetical protein